MSSILQKIGEATYQRIQKEKLELSQSSLIADLQRINRPINPFKEPFCKPGFQIIAEYKRASPSQGEIAPELSVEDVVSQYKAAGAAAYSILTEPSYFQGRLDFLRLARSMDPEAKILMKDFFVDEYQLYQALHVGADAILVIVGLLGREKSIKMYQKALSLGLSVLVEVHDQDELEIALEMPQGLLGINNRDLRDLSINLETTHRLMKAVPDDRLVISESGINTHNDLISLSASGVSGYLVGTSLMKTKKPGPALAKLLGRSYEN